MIIYESTDETLTERPDRSVTLPDPAPTDIETIFTSRSGAYCGKFVIQFVQMRLPKVVIGMGYAVDNSNLADLLRIISTCAAQ